MHIPLLKFAKKILISWEQSAKYFPKNKVVYSGLPLRNEIFTAISQNFDVNSSLPTIYITAGKTGSHKINQIIKESLNDLLQFSNVIHQCGDNSVYMDYDVLQRAYDNLNPKPVGKYFVRKFVLRDEIGEVFKKTSLVISRSGAHIVAELLALQKRAILIPIPWVSHNEQLINAKFLKEQGLAEILHESEINKDLLIKVVKEMLKMTTNSELHPQHLDAAKIIAHEITIIQK